MTDDAKTRASDDELIRSLWQEARDLIKRLEGSTVQRLAVRAGEYEIEIERGEASLEGQQSGGCRPRAVSANASGSLSTRRAPKCSAYSCPSLARQPAVRVAPL